jgi:hypothetical protein
MPSPQLKKRNTYIDYSIDSDKKSIYCLVFECVAVGFLVSKGTISTGRTLYSSDCTAQTHQVALCKRLHFAVFLPFMAVTW